jgi:hypothetical protein
MFELSLTVRDRQRIKALYLAILFGDIHVIVTNEIR